MRYRFRDTALLAIALLAESLDAVMTLDYNTLHATTSLDAIYDTNFPAGSILEIRTGAPAGADSAAGGTLLVSITLPATPWSAATGTGSKSKSGGAWTNTAAAAGTAASYRLKNAAGTKLEEGTVTATGGGGDMTLDNIVIASGQSVTVNTYTRTV